MRAVPHARGLPARAGGGYRGAMARPRPWATSVCFGIWGQSHTLGGAALPLSLALPLSSSEAGSGQQSRARDMFTSCAELHPSPVEILNGGILKLFKTSQRPKTKWEIFWSVPFAKMNIHGRAEEKVAEQDKVGSTVRNLDEGTSLQFWSTE